MDVSSREPVTCNLSGPRILHFQIPQRLGTRTAANCPGDNAVSRHRGGTLNGTQAGALDSIIELGWWGVGATGGRGREEGHITVSSQHLPMGAFPLSSQAPLGNIERH